MEKDPVVYLNDIIFSINLIEQYLTGVSLSKFNDSYDVQDAVLRRLEIIAEATKKLPEDLRNMHPAVSWKSIIGLRNIIAHAYNEVNLEEIWEIVTQHLPETKRQMEEIKASLPEIL